MPYLFITILLTVYGQIVIKWQVSTFGEIPQPFQEKIICISKLLFNPWILSGFGAAFLAAISWMFAVSKLQLSYAYPFVSLTFVFVLILSSLLFYEPLTWQKVVGVIFVISGVYISTMG